MSISYLKLHNLFQYLVSLKFISEMRDRETVAIGYASMTGAAGVGASLSTCTAIADVFFNFSNVCVCVFISNQTVLKRIFRFFFLANFYRDFELICKFIHLSINMFSLFCEPNLTCKSQTYFLRDRKD